MIGNISILPSKPLEKTQHLQVSSTPKPATAFAPPPQFGATHRHVQLVGSKLTVAVDASHTRAPSQPMSMGPGPMASPLRDRSNHHGRMQGEKRTLQATLKAPISPIRVASKAPEKQRGYIYAVVDTNQVVHRQVTLAYIGLLSCSYISAAIRVLLAYGPCSCCYLLSAV